MSKAATSLVSWSRWAPQVEALRETISEREGKPASPKVSQHARLVFTDRIGCMLAGRRAPELNLPVGASEQMFSRERELWTDAVRSTGATAD